MSLCHFSSVQAYKRLHTNPFATHRLDEQQCKRLADKIDAAAANRVGMMVEETREEEDKDDDENEEKEERDGQELEVGDAGAAPTTIKEDEDDDNDDVAFLNELVPVQVVQTKVEEKKWARVFEELAERFAKIVSRIEFEEIARKLGFDVDREDHGFVQVLVDALEQPLERWGTYPVLFERYQ